MLIKVTGNRHRGQLSCGHRLRRGVDYFIRTYPGKLFAICRECTHKSTPDKVIRIPQDLDEGDRIPLR